ncbi:uncharacterized protein LOC144343798 [Saccoglossus kowalevskii]
MAASEKPLNSVYNKTNYARYYAMYHESIRESINPLTSVTASMINNCGHTRKVYSDRQKAGKDNKAPKHKDTHHVHDISNASLEKHTNMHNAVSNASVEKHSNIHHAVNANLEEVLHKYPWMKRKYWQPNFFLTEHSGVSNQQGRNVVYVHHPKSGGSTLKGCVSTMYKKQLLNLGGSLTYSRRKLYTVNNKSKSKTHTIFNEDPTFGGCDILQDSSCSYFVILRDPLERYISSYTYCKTKGKYGDPMCMTTNVDAMTLKEWIYHHGSYVFRQMQFNILKICSENYFKVHIEPMMKKIQYNGTNPSNPPCWFRHKLVLDSMDESEKKLLLHYFLNNLKNWFEVIGILNEYQISLQLFQQVYGLPFYDMCNGISLLVTQYGNVKATDKDRDIKKNKYVSKIKSNLQKDPDILKILDYDIQIYQKALEIFQMQKKKYFEEKQN